MKKIIYLLICACFVSLLFTGCQKAGDSVKYAHGIADYPQYETVSELVNKATDIYEGTVTNLFFTVMESPTSMLYTVYEIETTTHYKGASGEKTYVAFPGGIKDYKVEDQLAVMQKACRKDFSITLFEARNNLTLGERYLFAVKDHGGAYQAILNWEQTAFSVNDSSDVTASAPTYQNIKQFFAKPEGI